MMKRGLWALLLMIVTVLPALAAPNNTTGPWGVDAAGFKNLSTALASPSTQGKTVVITKVMNINNKTTSRDIRVEPGGLINIAPGKTVTTTGAFSAGKYQAISTTGSMVFNGSGAPDEFFLVWWGGKGDNSTDSSPALACVINAAAGRQIIADYGTYRFLTSVTYSTTGQGYAPGLKIKGQGKYLTYFDNRTGGPLVTATSGTSVEDYQENSYFENFSIINASSSANTVGLKFIGLRHALVKGVKVSGQASHGILIDSTTGDATDNVHVDIEQSEVYGNGGWGIYASGGATAANALVNVRQSRIIANTLGGIGFYTMQNGLIEQCAIAANGGPGADISQTGGGSFSKNVIVRNNEFDTNTGTQLYFGSAENCAAYNNYFVTNSGGAVVTKEIQVATQALNIRLEDNMPRIAIGYTGVTMYDIAPGASKIKILGTDWSAWQATGNTKYADLGTGTIKEEDNTYLRAPKSKIVTVASMTNNYVPPNKSGAVHRIVIDSTAARNLSAPELAEDGMEITLILWNASGGSLSFTFDSVYQHETFIAPANGKQKVARYIYDAASVKWKVVGGWSGDM